MKNKYLFLLLFFCIYSYSQTMTEKYNSYLNRYEYFDSSGNLTGYKSYNSYLGVWEYFKENADVHNIKPIEYAKPPKDDNFPLLQQVANQKQNSYNSNHKKVEDCFATIQMFINNKELDLRARIESRFTSEVFNVISNKRYDYSNDSLTNQVIQFIKDKYMEILSSESKKLNDEIENRKKTVETTKRSVLPPFLMKYVGIHEVYKIEDYIMKSDGRWELTNVDERLAILYLTDDSIQWKRGGEALFTGRKLSTYDYLENGYYNFRTTGGKTRIDMFLNTIIFYDKSDESKKYIYYIKTKTKTK